MAMSYAKDREVDYTRLNVNTFEDPTFQKTAVQTAVDAALFVPFAVAGGVDTVMQSVGLFDETGYNMGTLLGDINEDMGEYYKTNEEAYRMTGEVASLFVPGVGVAGVGVKLSQRTGFLAKLVNKTTVGEKVSPYLFTSGNTIRKRASQAQAHAKTGYAQGVRTIEGNRPLADLLSKGSLEGAIDVGKETVAVEALMFATLNESDLFYPDGEYTTNMAMLNAGIAGVFSGVAYKANKYAIVNAAQAETALLAKKAQNAAKDAPVTGRQLYDKAVDILNEPGVTYSVASAAVDETAERVAKAATGGDEVADAERKVLERELAGMRKKESDSLAALGLSTPEGQARAREVNKAFPNIFVDAKTVSVYEPRKDVTVEDLVILPDNTLQAADAYKPLSALEKDAKGAFSVKGVLFSKDKLATKGHYNVDDKVYKVSVSSGGTVKAPQKLESGYTFDLNGGDYAAADVYVSRLAAQTKKRDDTIDRGALEQHHSVLDIAVARADELGLAEAYVNRMQLQSLALKYDVFKSVRVGKSADPLSPEYEELNGIVQALNLPTSDIGYPSAVVDLFGRLMSQGVKSFDEGLARGNVAYVFQQMKNKQGATYTSNDLTGNLLAIGGLGGKPLTPVLTVRPTGRSVPRSLEDLENVVTARNLQRNKTMYARSRLYKAVTQTMRGMPERVTAMKNVDGILGDGLVGGGVVTTKQFRGRATSAVQHAQAVTAMTYAAGNKAIDEMVAPLRGMVEKLGDPKYSHIPVEYGLYKNEYKYGWHVDDAGNIPKNAVNRRLFNALPPAVQEVVNEAWEADKLRLFYMAKAGEGVYKPVTVSADTQLVIDLMASTSAKVRSEFNAFNEANGRKLIQEKPLHLPPAKVRDKFVGYMADMHGDALVQFSGRTAKEFELQKAEAQKANPNLTFYTQGEYETARQMAGKEWGVLQNFTTPAQGGGAGGKRIGGKADVSVQAVADDYVAVLNGLRSALKSAHAEAFRPELNKLKALEASQEFGTGTAKLKGGRTEKEENAYDLWRDTLMEKHTDPFAAGKAATDFYDEYAGKMKDAIGKWTDAGQTGKISNDVKEQFKAVEVSLGMYGNPHATLHEFAENTLNVKLPPEFAKHATFLNRATYAMTIGVLDAGMAVLNYTSWLAVQPATIAALRMSTNEKSLGEAGIASWEARTGLVSHNLGADSVGNRLALINPMKFTTQVFSSITKPDTRKFLEEVGDVGLLDASLVESLNTVTAPIKGYRQQLIEGGLDKLSFMTQKSERHTKVLAAATNYTLGREVAGLSHADAKAFAIRQMDQVVGNYQPFNKPKLFQGAAGLPLGLFTTWITNYLQRLYGDIEGLRGSAAFWQMGLQGGLLGGESLPGWDALSNTLMASYDGEETLTARIDGAFGGAGDWILYGALGNIPKLMGADTGVAIHSRGSIGLPGVYTGGGNVVDSIPSVSVLATVGEGMLESAKSLVVNKGLNVTDQLEVLSNFGVFGSVKNTAEYALGYSVNRARELINDDTRDTMSFMARVLELKSIKETKTADALYGLKIASATRRGRMEGLNRAMRSAIRGGGLTEDKLVDMVNQAITNGTPVSTIKDWITRSAVYALNTKEHRAIESYLNGHGENLAARRVLEMYPEDD